MNGTSDWAQLLDRSDVLIVDAETTGAGKWAEVVDVALIDTTGAVRYNAKVLPASNIPSDKSIHGGELLLLRLNGARPWQECHESITGLLKGADTVLAYNAAHDKRVLNQTAIRYGLALPRDVGWRCLMSDYAAYRGGQRFKLEDASDCEGVLRGRQVHEALPDCQLALDLMRSVAGQHVPEPVQPESHGRIRRLWTMLGRGVFGVVSLAMLVPFVVVMSPILVPLALFEWWYGRKR